MPGQFIEQGLPRIDDTIETQRDNVLRLPEFSEQANHFNALLSRLMQTVMSPTSLYIIYRSLTATLQTGIPCDIALLIRMDNTKNDGQILAESGWSHDLSPLTFTAADLSLMKDAAFFSVPDNFLSVALPSSSSFNLQHTSAGICVSILVAGQPYAILVLLNRYTHPGSQPALPGQDVIKLMLALADSLSQRIYLEARLMTLREERDAAIHSNESKTQFLARISHEIRTPMSGVIGMMDLLRNTNLDSKQAEYLSVAEHTAETMVELINRFLDLAKIETGKMLLEEIVFNLPQMLDQTAEVFRNRAIQKNIAFQSDISEKLPTFVRGDPTRLGQIIVNLLGNSLKFTHQGHISFKTRCDLLGGDQIRLFGEVSDTGIGIPLEAQQRIFESFSQADESTSRIYGGTGLGLSICRQLVSVMGGNIEIIHSALGEGTTLGFSVTLSIADAPAQTSDGDTSATEAYPCARRAVLVGEDLLSSDLPHWLKDVGFTILPASTGLEALGLIKAMALPPCVVFVGNLLPGIRQHQLLGVLSKILTTEITRLVGIQSERTPADPATLPSTALLLPLDKDKLFDALPRLRSILTTTQSQIATTIQTPQPDSYHASESIAPVDKPAHTAKILIAEDNPVNRKVTMDTLAKLGYQAKVVENGAQAVEASQQQRFDLILMDCQMPVMDGYQATARIREIESPDGIHTPIVAITAHAMEGDRQKCLDAGMDDYLSKPIRMSLLKDMVEKWLAPRAE